MIDHLGVKFAGCKKCLLRWDKICVYNNWVISIRVHGLNNRLRVPGRRLARAGPGRRRSLNMRVKE